MSNTNEIGELKKAIQYIWEQIRENQSEPCTALREVSHRYLHVLLGRAMTKLAAAKQRELEQKQN